MSSLQEILEERRRALIAASVPTPPKVLSKWEQEQALKQMKKKRPSASGSKQSATQRKKAYEKYARSDEGWKDAAAPGFKSRWDSTRHDATKP